MRIILPPPLSEPPKEQSFWSDFSLLLKSQMRVTWNKMRHRSLGALIGMGVLVLAFFALFIGLGSLAYGALGKMSPDVAKGLISLLFMAGLASQIFFGLTAAFTALYMSDDLELLFMTPVPLKVVFAVKSLSVLGSNLVIALLFTFLPGVFYGLLFQAGPLFYILVVLVGMGLWIIGTALAELLNLLVMRIVPPHRSKEAVGFIGGLAGILMVLFFQLPNLMLNSGEKLDIGSWLTGKSQVLDMMDFFPWGWGSLALVNGISGSFLAGLSWALLIIFVGIGLFMLAFILLERGFRRGFISLSQGEGGRRRKKRQDRKSNGQVSSGKQKKLAGFAEGNSQLSKLYFFKERAVYSASPLSGVWAVAKKDLLSLKRDTREWFGYLVPLIIMAFFVGQFLLFSSDASKSSLITVLVMYTIMFSGNMALQSFGREGESDWLLNTVPLAGWPVVWGKLLGAVLPTLILMEALLVGTGIAIGLSTSLIILLMLAAILLSLGSSAIGLFYSINNSRYNPDKPLQRIAPGSSLIMYLINLFFIIFLSLGLSYIFPPQEMILMLESIPQVTYEGGILSGFVYGLYLLSRPYLWPLTLRVILGLIVTLGVWSLMFFGFMAATVRQSRKGFRVELVQGKKKKKRSKMKVDR